MVGGTVGGKEALDLVPPGDLGSLLERTVVHQLEAKKRHDRNYGERAGLRHLGGHPGLILQMGGQR